MPHFNRAFAALALIGCSLAGAPAAARDYPVRPLRVVVATQPGGGYDYIARVLAETLPAELGQPLIVENRPGAGMLVGTQAVVAAPADGYTLLIGGLANMALTPGMYEKPGYDPVADFTPVALIGSFTYTLVARKDLPQSTLQEVVAFARANPGRLTIATAGTGTGQHIAAELLKQFAKIDLLEIPFKGAQAAYTDVFGGRVDLFFDNTTTARPFVDAGRVKAIATSGANRDALLPNVPTSRESGVVGLELESWIGLFAPAKTPKPAIDELRRATAKVMESPEVRKRLETNGWKLLSMPPQETEGYVKAQAEMWTRFVRNAGIKGE